jgi:hypothetical protein
MSDLLSKIRVMYILDNMSVLPYLFVSLFMFACPSVCISFISVCPLSMSLIYSVISVVSTWPKVSVLLSLISLFTCLCVSLSVYAFSLSVCLSIYVYIFLYAHQSIYMLAIMLNLAMTCAHPQ